MATGKSLIRAEKPTRGGLARHLEGWQLVVVTVFLAGSVALVAVPRPVAPEALPLPDVRSRHLQQARQEDERLAAWAKQRGLDVDVRKLGSAMRDYGRAEARGHESERGAARQRVVRAAGVALSVSEEAVLALRAHQLQSFLVELRKWEQTGEESSDLRQLSGDFVGTARAYGWVEPIAGGRRVLLSGGALRALFKQRWNEVTSFAGPRFAVSIDERLSLYRFLLLHPIAKTAAPGRAVESVARLRYQAKKIEEVAALDRSYPLHFAHGVLLFWQRKYAQAADAFRKHLEARPDGPLTLRAQNHLAAAVGLAAQQSRF